MTIETTDIGRFLNSKLQEHNNSYVTTKPLTYWVDASVGNDAWEGTQDKPFASIIEAERRIPYIVEHPVFIRIKAHPGSGYAPPTFRQRLCRDNIYVIGEDYTELFSGFVSSNHNLNITSDTSYGVDGALRGKTLEILDGTMATERRTLRTNTGTSINPLTSFSSTVTQGSKFRVTEPAVVITTSASKWILSEGCGQLGTGQENTGFYQRVRGLVLVNLEINTNHATNLSISFLGSLMLFGVEITGPTQQVYLGGVAGASFLGVGADTIQNVIDPSGAEVGPVLGAKSNLSWAAWGLTRLSNNLHIANANAYIIGFNVNRAIFWTSPYVHVCAFHITNGVAVFGQTNTCNVTISRHTMLLGDSNTSYVEGSFNPVVKVSGMKAYLMIDCDIKSTANTVGVQIVEGARALLANGGGTITVNAGTNVGVQTIDGSEIIIGTVNTDGSDLVVTGTPAFSAGTITPVTSDSTLLSAKGKYLAHGDGSTIRRRS